MIKYEFNIEPAQQSLGLLEKEAIAVQKIVTRRLLVISRREIRKELGSLLNRHGLRRRLKRSTRYPRLYGYANPASSSSLKKFTPGPHHFKVRGIWFERYGRMRKEIRPVLTPIYPMFEESFEQAQVKLAADWETILETELERAFERAIGA